MTATELYSNSTLTDDPIGLLLGGPLDYTDRANMFDAFAPAAAHPHVISQVCTRRSSIQLYTAASPLHLLGTSASAPRNLLGTALTPLHLLFTLDASAPPWHSLDASAPPLYLLCTISPEPS